MKAKRVSRRVVSQQLFLALVFGASVAQAGVGVDLNIHMGDQPQPQPVIVRPQPQPMIVRPAPPPPPAPVVVQEVYVDDDVDFVYPEELGFYVAVGVPYDLFYFGNRYYLFRDGRWFYAPGSHGPWTVANYRELPPRLRRHRMERIREYRVREYDAYRHDRDHYRGRSFRVSKEEWKAQRRAEKGERKAEKERWKEERKADKERWKEERKEEKWERKHDRDR